MINVLKINNEFVDSYLDFLFKDEIKNNLMIGISQRVDPNKSHFVASVIEDRVLLGLLAGKNLIISANTYEIDVYIEMVNHMENIDYPGIIGEKHECLTYQEVYESITNKKMKVEMDQRIYSCSNVISNYQTDGLVRLADMNDFPILRYWLHEFNELVEGPTPIEETDKSLSKMIEQERLFALEIDGKVVSMAGKSRGTENSQTVGMVFTPKEYRKNGYASIVVEHVTRHILEYKKIATLYTDLSNPTSNSIYMKIGYIPHCDSIVLNINR